MPSTTDARDRKIPRGQKLILKKGRSAALLFSWPITRSPRGFSDGRDMRTWRVMILRTAVKLAPCRMRHGDISLSGYDYRGHLLN